MKDTKHDRGEIWVAGQAVLLAAVVLAPRRLPGLPELPEAVRTPLGLAGVAVGAAGTGVALAGARALGPNLTPFPRPREQGQLVQSGVYGVVRHPIYSGILLIALAWSLLRASPPSLLLSLLLALFFDRKARREELWLREKYPEYAEYARRVPRRVW